MMEFVESFYTFHRDGRIFSHNRRKFLQPDTSTGYAVVALKGEKGKYRKTSVHREIAKRFVPNPNNLPCVNHKDGNKLNNHADNLEWCTHKENTRHAINTGLLKVGHAKHWDSEKAEMLRYLLLRYSQRQVSELLNVSQARVSQIIKEND